MKGPWMDQPTQETNYKYNGIEKEEHHGLNINIAAYRVLDPAVGQWCSVDPKAEYLYGHTPYNSMLNNPISYTDPDGDLVWFVPVIAGVVGGFGNLAYNASKGNINSLGDGLKAFGIGAAAGVGATFAAVPAATALAGAIGVTLSGGFATGAFVGGVGAGIEEIARNAGNALVFKDVTWGEALGNIGMGTVTGAAVGGVYQGLKDAYGFDPFSGNFKPKRTGINFWNGQSVAPGRSPFALNNTPRGTEWGKLTFYSDQNALRSFSSDYARDITGATRARGKGLTKNYEVWDRSAAEAWESMTETTFRVNHTHYLEGGSRMRVYMDAKSWKLGPTLIHHNSKGEIIWKIRFWK